MTPSKTKKRCKMTTIQTLLKPDRIVLLAITIVLIVAVTIISYTNGWMDVNHYWDNINEWYDDGLIPYKDYVFEYPPLSLLIFLIPRLFSWDLDSYHFMYAIFSMIAYIGISKLTLDLTKDDERLRPYIVLLLLLIPIFGIRFILTRNDIFAVAAIIISIWCYKNNHKRLAFILIGLGAMIKLYPILLIVPYLANEISRRDVKSFLECIIIIAATCVIIELPFMIDDFDSAFSYLSYHEDRPIQIESVVATFMYFAYLLGYTDLHYIESYGSDNMWGELPDKVAPYMNDVLSWSLIIVIAFLLIIAIWSKKWDDNMKIRMFILTSLAMILTFIIFNKVYSAQYMLWVLGLTPLMIWSISSEKARRVGFVITIIFGSVSGIAAATYSSYDINDWFISIEATKNFLTIAMLCFVIYAIYTESKIYRLRA